MTGRTLGMLIVMIIYMPKGVISIPGVLKHKLAARSAKEARGEGNG